MDNYLPKKLDENQKKAVLALENDSKVNEAIIETADNFYKRELSLSKLLSSCYLHSTTKAAHVGEVKFFTTEKLDQISFYLLSKVLKERFPTLYNYALYKIKDHPRVASKIFDIPKTPKKGIHSKDLVGKRVIYNNDDHCCFGITSRQGWEGVILNIKQSCFTIKWDCRSSSDSYVKDALRDEIIDWPNRKSERSYIKIIENKTKELKEKKSDIECNAYDVSDLTPDEAFQHIASWSDCTKKTENKNFSHTLKGNTMIKKFKLSTVVYLDGTPVENITDDELISNIALLEQEIASLKKLKTTSKRVSEKIIEMKAKIMTLVGILDSRCGNEEAVEVK